MGRGHVSSPFFFILFRADLTKQSRKFSEEPGPSRMCVAVCCFSKIAVTPEEDGSLTGATEGKTLPWSFQMEILAPSP